MKYFSKFLAFYRSNYPTYLVSIALLVALVLILLSPRPAQAAIIGIDAGFFGGAGDARTEDGLSLRRVKTTHWGIYGLPGIRPLPWFKAGPYLEYHSLEQRTAPSSVGGSDITGSGHILGAGVSFNFSPIYLLAAYGFSGTFSPDAPTTSGLSTELSELRSLHGMVGIYLNPFLTFDLGYMGVEYSKLTAGIFVFDVGRNKYIVQNFRGGFSIHF